MGLEETINFLLPRVSEATGARAVQLQVPPRWAVYDASISKVSMCPPGHLLRGRLEIISLGELRGRLLLQDSRKLSPVEKEMIARVCGHALDNARQYEKWKEERMIEKLTGLLNRSAWEERLNEEIARADREGSVFCVAFFDVDNFKEVNDTRGHLVGDEVLRNVAEVFRKSVRSYDVVARYGGDEFVCLFPGISYKGGIAAAARVAEAVANAVAFPVENRPSRGVILSFGVAAYPDDGQRPEELVAVADKRMYESKRNKACGG